ncbi:hypothetical protein GW765_00760 [Candidatus Parcubacteria bacterium]|nr:hypothetical protein [Candidatus Parcubacteria bacterium]
MREINPKTKRQLLIFLVSVSMLAILAIWMIVSPPQYFKTTDQPGIFDTIKTEFSDIF